MEPGLIPSRIPIPGHGSVSAALRIPHGFRRGRTSALLLSHGAGNDMHLPLLAYVATRLAEAGHLVLRLNFPYAERRRKAPDRAPVLMATLRAGAAYLRDDERWSAGRIYLGGKSMGGRMASMLAAEGFPCDGLIFLGYPLHPAGQPDRTRDAHFSGIKVPALFLQGTLDPLCDLALLRPRLRRLGAPARLHVIEKGDHSFKVPKSFGRTEKEVWDELAAQMNAFITPTRIGGKRDP